MIVYYSNVLVSSSVDSTDDARVAILEESATVTALSDDSVRVVLIVG